MAHICHGWDGVGIEVRGAAAFWAWNWVQVSHCWTASSTALLMPGQKTHPWVNNCALVAAWWNWWSCWSILSPSDRGTMRASPCRMRPCSTVRVSHCSQYGHNGQGTTLMSSGQPVMIMLVRACILGSLTKACWNASFLSGDRWAWWMAMSSGMSGPGHGLNWESVSGRAISLPGW